LFGRVLVKQTVLFSSVTRSFNRATYNTIEYSKKRDVSLKREWKGRGNDNSKMR
jgi:hypothetical protein